MRNFLPATFLFTAFIYSFLALSASSHAKSLCQIKTEHYNLDISEPGFRFQVQRNGKDVFAACPDYGLAFLGSPARQVKLLNQTRDTAHLRAKNSDGQTALIEIKTHDHSIEILITLENEVAGEIRLRSGIIGPAYGLGDNGSFGESANLARKQKTYAIKHDGGGRRWLSSFLVFPQAGGAGVMFDRQGGSVAIGPDYYEMANANVKQQKFYYFVGTMPEIYSAYHKVRIENGYPGVPPKPEGFELGWESWDALRWNTNAKSVQKSIQRFLDKGYPIRWAVTGSGFWQKAGSTVHFGKYDESKYPDENGDGVVDLKAWMQSKQVKWMIGQRVNFVPPGGPHSSNPGESGATIFDTSPDSQAGLQSNYFLEAANGQPAKFKSSVFPTVPCFLLDGNRPEAADWFNELYRTWGVDGVKEDTMMPTTDHTIYNSTMRKLADEGALVMARCGAYSSPGTLTRINDTHGPSSMGQRAPINYLQYAASAAPNVYSDTVGFAHIHDINSTLRHAWFTSLTAGMAVGSGPWKWSAENQAHLKKAIDFHYTIGPYLYSAAADSHQTGYPLTMTPLPIAYPDDANTYDMVSKQRKQFQWMVGPSLLAAPVLSKSKDRQHLDIYLPAGKWIDFDTGQLHLGPKTLRQFEMPVSKTPVFVGGKGVIVRRVSDEKPLLATVYPVANEGSTFHFTFSNQIGGCKITNNNEAWNTSTLTVTDTTANTDITFTIEKKSGAISFELTPGHKYELTGGSVNAPAKGAYSEPKFDGHDHPKYAPVANAKMTIGKPIHCYRDPWIMDHTVVYDPAEKKWHMFGIYGDQTRFLHLTADSLTHEGWERQEDFRGADATIWAPHIISHDDQFWMYYTGIGDPRKIDLSRSKDLKSWDHHPENPLLAQQLTPTKTNMKNKDPMILKHGGQWIMYYSMVKDDKANWVVGYSTSSDLINWEGPHICFDEDSPAPGVESPFVVRRGKYFYLFLSARPWGVYDGGTDVFRSESPFAWKTSDKVKRIQPWHAAEIIRDLDGKWYITNCGFHKDGFWLAPLNWNDGIDEDDTSMPIPGTGR